MRRNTRSETQTPSHGTPVAGSMQRRAERRRARGGALRSVVSCLLVFILLYQPSLTLAGPLLRLSNSRAVAGATRANDGLFVAAAGAASSTAREAFGYVASLFTSGEAAPDPSTSAEPLPSPPPITDAAISRNRPSLNSGRIEGTLRVFSSDSYSLNSPFHLTGDLYAVGTPNIVLGSNASHGGVVDDGGSATPSGYNLTLGGGIALPGRIHKRADALALPPVPSSVPVPLGTRDLRINSTAEAAQIGDWKTVRDLTVSSGAIVTAPPGDYGTFTVNGSSRINFTAGTYNFTGPLDLNGSGSVVQMTGKVTVNVGQGVKVGDTFDVNAGTIKAATGTLPGDIIINVLGNAFSINGTGEVTGLVRAPNAVVKFNGTNSLLRGQVIAGWLDMSGGRIIGDTSATVPPDTQGPTVAITSPASESSTSDASITVAGTASDPGEHQTGVSKVFVNNTEASFNAAAGTWTISGVGLSMGANTVTARAVDVAGNQSQSVITVTRQEPPRDTVAPTVAFTSPASGSTYETETVDVSGTVADAGAPTSGVASVTVNGAPATLDAQAGTWSLSGVALNVGPNTITARALDAAGNQSPDSVVSVTRREPADIQSPQVAITSPAAGSTTFETNVTVTGTASDPGQYQTGVRQVFVNDQPAQFDPATGQWTLQDFALALGANTITARAVDGANNPSSAVVRVTRELPPDTAPPALQILTPADGSQTDATSVTVSGSVTDTGVNASGVGSVTVNGALAAYDAADGTWTLRNFALALGPNDISVRAVDQKNNEVTKAVRVTRVRPPDTAPPALAVTSPAEGAILQDDSIVVTGTAFDEGDNATGVRSVTVNGAEAAYDSQSRQWSAAGIRLAEGLNVLTVAALDNAPTPNRREVTLNVTLRTPDRHAPVVTIVTPAASDTYDSAVTVTGTATDDGLNSTGVRRVSVNGREATYDAATRQWAVNGVQLAYGENTVVAVATDGAEPAHEGRAELRVTRLRVPAPTLTITNPTNGGVYSTSSITVAGEVTTISTEPVAVTVNGQPASVSGGRFTRTLTLAEGTNAITVVATDALGQSTQSSVSVLKDQTPPTVAFSSVPASVQPGASYRITVEAADNVGVGEVEFRVDGARVASSTTAPYQFTLDVPTVMAAGNVITLAAVARDLSGATSTANAQTRTAGPGGVSGYVFDDTTGYPLEGVLASAGGQTSATTDAAGTFSLVASQPTGAVRLTKDGHTFVERLYTVTPGEGAALFDARLTPLDARQNQITPAGGAALGDSGRLRLEFDPGVFDQTTDVRLTAVSPQGLANLLPFGWSPVPGGVVDVRAGGNTITTFQTPARLRVARTHAQLAGHPLVFARYDEQSRGWKTLAEGLNAAADGSLSADVPAAGQYAFLVADTGATAPPSPSAGLALPSSRPAESAALDAATATAMSSPRVAGYTPDARSTISFVATSPAQLPSGVSVEASFGETYTLLGGKDSVLVDRTQHDFVLYAFPEASAAQPNRLGASFVAKPTRTDFTVAELLGANVHVDIRSGRQTKTGVLVGGDGGTLTTSNGGQLSIPRDALDAPQPVFFNDLATPDLGLSVPEGYAVVGAFDVNLSGATLAGAGVVSTPVDAGDSSRLVLARLVSFGGVRALKVVARAVVTDGRFVSTVTGPAVPSGVTLPGVTSSGRYAFVRLPHAFGYAKGVVTDGGAAAAGVRVSNDRTPFVDFTLADGRYVVVGNAETGGAHQLGAVATSTDATGKATATLAAQDAVADAAIALQSAPLAVESVTPADGAQNMIVTTPVTVSFNKPVSPQSVTNSTLKLQTASGNPVLGQLTVMAGGRAVVFTPSNTLAGSTAYRVSVTQGVRDVYAKPLAAAFTSTFNTSAVVKVDDRLKPEKIRIDYPDAGGVSKITIAARAVPEGSTVIAVNEASGSTVSTVAGTTAVELNVAAQVGDLVTLIVRQPDGSEYRVTQAAYRRADGFTSVGSNGGSVVTDDGKNLLEVPAGAVVGQADFKLAPLAESQITTPRLGEMNPQDVPFGGGVKIRAEGQFELKKELHLEVAVPEGVQVEEGQRAMVMMPSKMPLADGSEREMWESVTSARVEGGRYKTTSPPFVGLWVSAGIWDVYIYIPRFVRAVYGTVKEKVPGGAPKPLGGVAITIINATGTDEIPYVWTKSNDHGGFGTFDPKAARGSETIVRARDQAGREKTALAAPDLNTNPFLYPGMDGIKGQFASVEFDPQDAGGPETKPAILHVSGRRADVGPDEPDSLVEEGIVSVGTEIIVGVDIFPQVATFRGRLLVNGTETQTLDWETQPPAPGNDGGERRLTRFRVPSQGSYTVDIETYTKPNAPATRARATYNFVGLANPNVRPPLPGSPRVLAVTPPDNARQVDAGRRIHLEFSEPVKNLVPETTVYLLEVETNRKLGGRLFSGGVPVAANSENISQLDFEPEGGLAGGRQYEVHVTTGVVDTDGNALDQDQTSAEDDSPQPFKSAFKTFAGIVLTDAPTADTGHRIATAGQYAATITGSRGSRMTIYDMSNPGKPSVVGSTFVPDWAVSVAMVEVEDPEHNFKVGNPRQEYSRIAVVASVPIPSDTERPTNMWVYSLEDPAKPQLVGVVSLSFASNLTANPSNMVIHGKRAYIGATPQGGTYAVDIEQAMNQWAAAGGLSKNITGGHPMITAVRAAGGFAKDAKKQTVTYGDSKSVTNQGSAPVNSVSTITQVVSHPQHGLRRQHVAYVTPPNKPQFALLGFAESDDNINGFYDRDNDGRDDRVLTLWDLEPAGFPREVQARSGLKIKGRTMDVAVVLGHDRLWIHDTTDPLNVRSFPSRTFTQMGIANLGYALRMDVEDTLAYIIFRDHIAVVDFSVPENPARVATIEKAGVGMRWVSVKDGFIYSLSSTGITVSIARPASQVIVYGQNANDDRICTNPVVLSRDNRMAQPAGVYFQVFGSDLPQSAQVVIRRERAVGDQRTEETLATLPAQIDRDLSSEKVVVGRAAWNPGGVIDRSWSYTAEVVFNQGGDSEFHARREPIPFSYLIAEAMRSFGSAGGKGYYNYVLGGNAGVTLTVNGQNVLEDAADPRTRPYGLNADLVKHELPDGVYPFTLRASLENNPSVSDEIEGEMVVANKPRDVRLPGNTTVSDVELQNGNLGLSHSDARIPNRGLSLGFTRSYNTASANAFGPLGYGWGHNYQVLLVHDRQARSYTMRGGDGGGQLFKEDKLADGKIEAEDPHVGSLVKNADGSFDYFTRSRVKYHFPGAMEEDDSNYFNLSYMGNLQYMEEPNGNRLTLTYDTQGRMTRAADSSGRALDFTYEQAETPLVGVIAPTGAAISCTNKGQFGIVRSRFIKAEVGKAWRIREMKGPGGLKIEYEYDADGNLTRVARDGTDTISQAAPDYVWQYEYNPPGPGGGSQRTHLLRAVTAPNDTPTAHRVTTYDYHFDLFRAPVKSVTLPEGVTNTFTYTYASNLVTEAVVADGRGNPTTYSFDRASRTTTAVGPRGARTVTVFNEKGQPSSETDAEGTITRTEYERGNPTSVSVTGDRVSTTTSTRYDPTFNKPVSSTDQNGRTMSFALDSRGNVTLTTLPTGRTIRAEFASNGDVSSITDAQGATTNYTYDAYGSPVRVQKEGGVSTTRVFDVRGRMVSSAGTLEPSVEHTYDALDRVVRTATTDPSAVRDETIVTYTRLPAGQVVTSTHVSGAQRVATSNTHDALDRVTRAVEEVSGAGTFTREFTYDANSNLLSETDRRGVKHTHVYDELNFRTSTTVEGPHGASKTTSRTTPNLLGQPLSVTDLYGQSATLEYDGLQRLVKRTLPGGYTEEMTYDGVGNVTSSKDRNGRTSTTSYDAADRPVEQRDAADRLTTYVYDDAQRSTTVQHAAQGLSVVTKLDALGRTLSEQVRGPGADYTTSYQYQGLTVRVTDPRGVLTTKLLSAFGEAGDVSVAGADPAYSAGARYTGFGGLKSSRDALNRETAFTLDGFNRATSVSHPGGFGESMTYDGEGLTLSHTDRRGVRSSMVYDNLGRRLSLTVQGDGAGFAVQTVSYEDGSLSETHTDARGKKTVITYDGLRRPVSVKNAENKTRTMEYDGVNLLRESDFKSQVTSYAYDGADRVTQINDRAGQLTAVAHSNGGGYTKTVTDRRGNRTVESYDALGRLKSLTRGGETVHTFEYDGNSNVTSRTDGRNNRSSYTYDALGRVKSIDHAGAQTESFVYDAVGNLLEHSDGAGAAIRQTFDALDRPRTRTDGAGNTTQFRFDGEGLLLERVEPKGGAHKTSFEYNALGSLVKVTDAAQGVWQLDYDPAQNLTGVTDARSQKVSYTYDDLNRVTRVRQPLNLITEIGYDANGNVTSKSDPKGQTTSITYDALDRPRATTYGNGGAGGPVRHDYNFDPEGNLTEVSETMPGGGRRSARTYDARDRLTSATDSFGFKVAYGYDAADNVTSVTDAASRQTRYTYDGRNRVETVTLPGAASPVGYSWRSDGLISEVTYGAGMKRSYSYDGGDRLTGVVNSLGVDAQGAAQTEEYAYTYDPNSNRRTETRKYNGGTYRSVNYEYDALDRLVQAAYADQAGTRTLGYRHDAVGNRTGETAQYQPAGGAPGQTLYQRTYSYDDLNRLLNVSDGTPGSEVAYGYDPNGNMTSVTRGGQLAATYQYDVSDQLRGVTDGAQRQIAAYDYDADRRRISKILPGVGETRYVYGGGSNVLDEFDGFNRLLARYDYGDGPVRGEFAQEGARYYFSDAQGSVTALSGLTAGGGSASPAARSEYDAWGALIGSAGGSSNQLGYTGQRHDPETGLMPLGAGERYYEPSQGRFIQQDSWAGVAALAQTTNRYAYGLSNPLAYTDPSGNAPVPPPGGRDFNIWKSEGNFSKLHEMGKTDRGSIIVRQRPGGGEPELLIQDRNEPVATGEIRGNLKRAAYNAGMEGLNDSNQTSRMLKNWAARTGYDVWNFFTFGLLEENDVLVDDFYSGRISEQDYYEGRSRLGFRAALSVATLGAGAVAGRLTTAISARVAVANTVAGRAALGAGVAAGERFAFESAEKAVGLRDEYSGVGSYALSAGLGGTLGALTRGARQPAKQAAGDKAGSYPRGQNAVDDVVDEADDFLEVYHGTSKANAVAIREQGISLLKSRPNLDFGRGFYTTTDKVQAMKWAARNTDGGELLTFRIAATEMNSLRGLNFPTATSSWGRFVRHHRLGGRMHGYDFVEGPMLGRPNKFLRGGSPGAWGQQTSWNTQKAAEALMKGIQP